jgi:hypothetical protein
MSTEETVSTVPDSVLLIPVIGFTKKQMDQIELVWETFSYLVRHGTVDIEEPIILQDLIDQVVQKCTKPGLTKGEIGECHEQGHLLYDQFINWIEEETGHKTYLKCVVKS